MSIEDWLGGYEYMDEGNGPDVECRNCGKAGLHWEELEPGRWQLFDEHKMHKCNQARIDKRAAADFEDLDK